MPALQLIRLLPGARPKPLPYLIRDGQVDSLLYVFMPQHLSAMLDFLLIFHFPLQRLIRLHLAELIGDNHSRLPRASDSDMDVDDDQDSTTQDRTEAQVIMLRMMNEAGIQSFSPDFTQPCDSPDNEYLMDLAVKIFVELVNCGEYTGIDLEVTSEEQIRNALCLHFTQRLRRQ